MHAATREPSRYHMRRNGVATNEGTSHLTLHLTRLVFSSGSLSPSMRLAVMSAQMPASERRRRRAAKARPVGGIEEGVPEFAGLLACSGDGEPCIARREHEGKNAVDDDEREGGGAGIDPADLEVQLGVDACPRWSSRPRWWSSSTRKKTHSMAQPKTKL